MNDRLKPHLVGIMACLVSSLLGTTAVRLVDGLGTPIRLRVDESVLIVDGNDAARIQVTSARFATPDRTSDVLVDVTNTTDRDATLIMFTLTPASESVLTGYPIIDYGEPDPVWCGSTRQVGPPIEPGQTVTLVIDRATYEGEPLKQPGSGENRRVPRLHLTGAWFTDGTNSH